MNKARKRRQSRKERDLRWVRSGKRTVLSGTHRYKKIHGLPEREDKKRQAFWCHDTDERPLISRMYLEVGDG